MDRMEPFMEKVLDLFVGVALLFIALSLVALGLTFLPVIGYLLAIPVIGASISFFGATPGKA